MHKNLKVFHRSIGTELDQFISDLILPSKDVEVLETIKIVFCIVELLVVHHHFVGQT
jgi:hypothetical protein